MSNQFIYEVEINFSNLCGADCIICSRYHGCGNIPFMDNKVFKTLLTQLRDIDFEMIQTSGNGEAFLNPNYLSYVRQLKNAFPNIPRWTYNNFSLINKERADTIVDENLFDKVHVRIDSLDKQVFQKNSNLNPHTVFENLKYFLSINKNIPVVILYNNIVDYYSRCNEVLGIRPTRDYFTDQELRRVKDEENDIQEYFQQYAKVDIDVCRIGHSLWGERERAPKDETTSCPKYDIIKNITWVCPNGDISTCCYDDKQSDFIAGNILEQHLIDIFNGERRMEILENIKNRKYKDYPCSNPKCCEFPIERKMK